MPSHEKTTVHNKRIVTFTTSGDGYSTASDVTSTEEMKSTDKEKTLSSTERKIFTKTHLNEDSEGLKKVTENEEIILSEVTNYEKGNDDDGHRSYIEKSKRASITSNVSSEEVVLRNNKAMQKSNLQTLNENEKKEERKETPKHHKNKFSPIYIRCDEELTLYAHNYIRRLHGSPPLKWDINLANDAKAYVKIWAKKEVFPKHKNTDYSYGENAYRVTGFQEFAKPYHAVFLWYRSVLRYNFEKPIRLSRSYCGTQLLWYQTTHVGLASAYREDTQTTYIVARYAQPGNEKSPESFTANIKLPIQGLPVVLPELDDLIVPGHPDKRRRKSSLYINSFVVNIDPVCELFCKCCRWCSHQNGDKPVEGSWFLRSVEVSKKC